MAKYLIFVYMLKYVKIDKIFCFLFLFPIFFIYDFLFCLAGVGREQEKKVYYFNVFLY